MPDRGLLTTADIAAPALDGAANPPPWTLTGATWAQLTYEVDKQSALSLMPTDVSRPVPAYARLIVIEAVGSPVGPLRAALLFVGGRYRLLGKNVLAEAIVDGPADAFTAAFGGPVRPGSVSLQREGSRFTATVSDAEGGLATLTLPALRPIDPAMLRWDGWLHYASADGVKQIVEVAPRAAPAEAFLSKGATLDVPGALARTHLWRRFRNLNTVSACLVEGELTLPAPETQQTLT